MNVKYVSPAKDCSGYSEAARNAILSLDKAKVGLTTENISFQPFAVDLGAGGRIAIICENKDIEYEKIIIHLTPDNFRLHLEPTKYHIGHFYWETDKLNEIFKWNANLMDEIWMGTPSYIKRFREQGLRSKMVPMPDCIDTNFEPYKPFKIKSDAESVEFNGFLFYSIFQWTPRKNPEALVKTFLKTFDGKDDVALLLKTYRVDYSSNEQAAIQEDIRKWKSELNLKNPPKIFLVLNPMSRDEIMRLHATGNCFVSAHKGEGWGYPQMEAMASGNPIISTNYGGIHEWIDESVGWLVPYKMVPVSGMDWIVWYDPSQNWAEIDTKALSIAMKEAYSKPRVIEEKGKAAKQVTKEKFSLEEIGKYKKSLL